jgi:hypothetical protein
MALASRLLALRPVGIEVDVIERRRSPVAFTTAGGLRSSSRCTFFGDMDVGRDVSSGAGSRRARLSIGSSACHPAMVNDTGWVLTREQAM